MNKILVLTMIFWFALLAGLGGLGAQSVADVCAQVDTQFKADQHQASADLINTSLEKAANAQERAELYWRLSRAYEALGKYAAKQGKDAATVQGFFSQGEAAADKGIAADSRSAYSYYWKSANVGRWAESRGIFDSLFKAEPMRQAIVSTVTFMPEHTDSYSVLCQLYAKLPGWPLSFGNPDWAVSFGRYAIALNGKGITAGIESLGYDYYAQLANALWTRGWDARGRQNAQAERAKQYARAKTAWEKAAFYEGTVSIDNVSDRQEAEKLIRWVAAEINRVGATTFDLAEALSNAKNYMKEWGLR